MARVIPPGSVTINVVRSPYRERVTVALAGPLKLKALGLKRIKLNACEAAAPLGPEADKTRDILVWLTMNHSSHRQYSRRSMWALRADEAIRATKKNLRTART